MTVYEPTSYLGYVLDIGERDVRVLSPCGEYLGRVVSIVSARLRVRRHRLNKKSEPLTFPDRAARS